MIIIVPLAPILIAVVVLILSLLIEVSSWTTIINVIIWIIIIILSIILVVCNIRKKTEAECKVANSFISIFSTIISMFQTKSFTSSLAAVDTSSLGGIIWFGITLILGGAFWLGSVYMCIYASFLCIDEEDNSEKYFKSAGLIIGSIALSFFSGLF